MPHDVFISYSNKNKQVADAVCALLEQEKIRCWIAPRDITPGAPWANAIIDGIAQCRVMIVVFSAHADASEQVKREVDRALHDRLTIIPIRIEPILPTAEMAYYMSSVHWLDALTPPIEQHLQKLAGQIRVLLGGADAGTGGTPAGEGTQRPADPPPRRRREFREPTLSPEQAKTLLEAARTQLKLSRIDEALGNLDTLINEIGGTKRGEPLWLVLADVLLANADTRAAHRSPQEALIAYDELIDLLGDATEVGALAFLLKGMRRRIDVLLKLGRRDDALAAFDRIASRFELYKAEALIADMIEARSARGTLLAEMGRNEEAIAAFYSAQSLVTWRPGGLMGRYYAMAIAKRGDLLMKMGRLKDAQIAYAVVAGNAKPGEDEAFDDMVATCQLKAGDLSLELGKFGISLQAYDPFIMQYRDTTSPQRLEQLATAMLGRAVALTGMSQRHKSLDAYDQLLARFTDLSSSKIAAVVGQARTRRAALVKTKGWSWFLD
jgi:tetratricopeptide (TPR) repeat protein